MGFNKIFGNGGSGTGTGGTTDHNALTNKNLPNQHTIAAVTGLLEELGKRPQTSDVNVMINSIINGAPEAYNTLKEIADYIAQDQSAGASILATLGNKVDKEAGKGLSSNDYTNIDKGKVHDHANTSVLGKIGESTGGNITYNGVEIGGSSNSTITADQINNTPAGNITASNVQAAINELDAKKLSSQPKPRTDYNTVWGSTGFYESIVSDGGPTWGWGRNSAGLVIGSWVQMVTMYGPGTNATNEGRTYTRISGKEWKKLAITDDITASDANFSFKTDNAYSFGTSDKRATQLYAATATINTSDRNAKKDITETQLGLDFINKLKPVEYKYKVRQNVVEQIQDGTQTIEIAPAETNEKGKVIKKAKLQEIPVYKEVVTSLPGIRTHLGLIAQDVEECLGGRDLAIVTKDENGYGLRYEELIAPLIKAVQELSAEVAELRNNKKK